MDLEEISILTQKMKEEYENTTENKEERKIENIEDLVLVHKTKYMPKGIIKSQKDIPEAKTREQDIRIVDKLYPIRTKHERNTVHFCVNGEVGDHMMGKFSGARYEIIIPGELIDKKSFHGGMLVDLWTKGSYTLPNGAIIVCPETEMEEVQKENPNCRIVGFEGEIADGYGNLLLDKMGYSVEGIKTMSWSNSKHSDDANSILFQGGLINDWHFRSKFYKEEFIFGMFHEYNEVMRIIHENNLYSTYDVDKLYQESKGRTKTLVDVLKEYKDEYPNADVRMFISAWKKEMEKYIGVSFDEDVEEKISNIEELEEEEIKKVIGDISKTITEPEIVRNFPNIDEWASNYKNALENASNMSREEKDNIIQGLKVNTDIVFFSDKTQSLFYSKLEDKGITIPEPEKKIIQELVRGEELKKILNNDKYSTNLCCFLLNRKQMDRESLIAEILGKEINDAYLLSKTKDYLDEREKKEANAKISEQNVYHGEEYLISGPRLDSENQGIDVDIGLKSRELIKGRLDKYVDPDKSSESSLNINLGNINSNETIGGYISRLKRIYELIERQIDGEEVNFDEIARTEIGKNEQLMESTIKLTENISKSDMIQMVNALENDMNKDNKDKEDNTTDYDEH